MICCQHFQGLFASHGLCLEVISLACDVNNWKTKLCRIWDCVLDPWFQCWHISWREDNSTNMAEYYYTWVIFENGSDSQGIRGKWKTSLLFVNKHLFVEWFEVFCFALWGQSFCSSKLLFLFQGSWRIDTLIWVSQMNKSFLPFFCFILLNWLFNLLGVSNNSSARILDVLKSVKESNHKKMSKRMYI